MAGRRSPAPRRSSSRITPRASSPRQRRAAKRRKGLARLSAFVVLLAAVIVLAAIFIDCGGPGSTGDTADRTSSPSPNVSPSSTASPTAALFVPSGERPLRLQNYGDSMGGELGFAITPLLKDTGLVKPWAFYKVSSSLVKPEFFSWPKYIRDNLQKRHIDAIIFMVGTNDGQGMVKDGQVLDFGTSTWKKEYARRVGVVLDRLLKPPARRVYWVGMPVMKSDAFSSVMRTINQVAAAEVKKHAGARYVDTWKLMSTSSGAYDPRWRQDDGVHFSIEGQNRLAKAVLGVIKKDWKIE